MSAALPRPILKHSSQSHPELSSDRPLSLPISRQCRNTVHFPPSPTLTRTFSAYSSSTYDRSPIVVLPNTCALPARGCPGRTYIPGCTPSSLNSSPDLHSRKAAINSGGRHMHPRRALGFIPEATPGDLNTASDIHPPPPLIPDVSSESDESDGFTGSPSQCNVVPNPLAFMPFASLPNLTIGESMLHSPESPKEEEEHHYHRYEEKRRRRKRDRGKGGRDQCPRQRSHGPDSIRDLGSKATNNNSGEELEEDDEAEDDDIQSHYKSFYLGTSLGGCGLLDDETCLGGF